MARNNHLSSLTDPKQFSAWGNSLFRFSAIAILVSSVVKFLHPAKPLVYLASMGYEGGTVFVIAAAEMAIGILCLLPATRRAGLLLISAFLGGAVASHIATHRTFTGGPFITYMAYHPYTGALIPGALLAIAWVGDYLIRVGEAAPAPRSEVSPSIRQVLQPIFDDIAAGARSPAR
ncbi:MAG: DoxX family protein [Acidobacteria bacterium]|nr:DoxX family protein [Acidobacteriota bacterium]